MAQTTDLISETLITLFVPPQVMHHLLTGPPLSHDNLTIILSVSLFSTVTHHNLKYFCAHTCRVWYTKM